MNIKIVVFGIFMATVFTGCAPKYIDVNKSLSEGKSIVIVPTYYEQGLQMYWRKMGDKKPHVNKNINAYYHNLDYREDIDKYFRYDFLIDANYQILAVEPGVYYISQAYTSIPDRKYDKKLSYTKQFNSTIGNIEVEKTPERVEEYGKRRDAVSYYKMRYKFANSGNINDPKAVGTITVKPNEIVLVPTVWVNVEIADDSCKRENEELFLFQVLDVFLRPSTLLYSNDEDTWYWSCPIKSITINIKTKTVDDFMSEVALSPFSKEDFSNITVRNFEFGKLLKQAKKAESLEDGTELYIISGDVDEGQ
jgi:hypothetical protein